VFLGLINTPQSKQYMNIQVGPNLGANSLSGLCFEANKLFTGAFPVATSKTGDLTVKEAGKWESGTSLAK
jgi:hypothetical protein